MSCVLRVSGSGLDTALASISLKPYRMDDGTAHFDVSKADFRDLPGQIADAVDFLQDHAPDLRVLLAERDGVLDFGVAWRDVAAQFDTFPPELVQLAAGFGLALEMSHYPVEGERGAEA